MKTKYLLILVMFLTGHKGLSQITFYDVDGGYFAGYQYNVFHSPEDYQDAIRTYSKSDLIQSSLFHNANLDVQFKRYIKQKHKIRFGLGGEVQYYFDKAVQSADQKKFYASLKHDFDFKDKWTLASKVIVDRAQKLGLNVLGDELLTSFSHTDIAIASGVTYSPSPKSSTSLDISYLNKNYVAQSNLPSLTSTSVKIKLETEQTVIGPGLFHVFTFGTSFRDRNYSETLVTDVLDPNADPNSPTPFLQNLPADYPYETRHWQYVTAHFDYNLKLNSGIALGPIVDYQKRTDISDGDFTKTDLTFGFQTKYRSDKLDIDLDGYSSTWNYLDRLAEQDTGTPFPNLSYDIIRAGLKVAYNVKGAAYIFLKGDYLQRTTNTTVIDKRTRRNYTTYQVMLGVLMKVKGKIRPKESKRR